MELGRDRDSGSESDRDRDDVDDDDSDSEEDSEEERDEGGDGDQRMSVDRQDDEREREDDRDRGERHASECFRIVSASFLKLIYMCVSGFCSFVLQKSCGFRYNGGKLQYYHSNIFRKLA